MKTVKTWTTGAAAVLLISGNALAANLPLAGPDGKPDVRNDHDICNSYGQGYIPVPGTKTCMRFSGYVRAEIKGGDNIYAYKGRNSRDSYAWRARGELRLHTASETELGKLLTLIDLRSQWDDGGDTLGGQLRAAHIQLGGLRVGLDESIFWYWTGYLGKVLNDDMINPGMYQRTNALSYTYGTGDDFSALLGFEQGTDSGSDNRGENYYLPQNGGRVGPDAGQDDRNNADARHFYSGSSIDDYVPNVLVGARYVQRWGSVATIGVYESRQKEWAAKLRLNMNVNDDFTLWLMGGYRSGKDYYAYDDVYTDRHRNKDITYYYRMHNSQYADWGGHWALWSGSSQQLFRRTTFNTQLAVDETRTFSAAANIAYDLTPGLSLTPEISYRYYGDRKKWDDGSRVSFYGEKAFQGAIRLQRSF